MLKYFFHQLLFSMWKAFSYFNLTIIGYIIKTKTPHENIKTHVLSRLYSIRCILINISFWASPQRRTQNSSLMIFTCFYTAWIFNMKKFHWILWWFTNNRGTDAFCLTNQSEKIPSPSIHQLNLIITNDLLIMFSWNFGRH